jgi:hypothetical protein
MIKFGIKSNDLESAARSIEAALGTELFPHESSFRGGDYFRAEILNGTMLLQNNRDVLDGEPFEDSWPTDQFVLYLAGADDLVWEPYVEALRATLGLQATPLS